jgi:hypothetical protein
MRQVSRPYGPIYGPALVAFLLVAGPAFGQTTVTDTSGSNSSSTSGASARTRSTATGSIAGTQVNAPITARGGSSTSRASQNVKVVNVTPNYGAGTNGANGTNATDPAGANGTNGANSADPPALGSAANPLTETINGSQTLRNTPEIVAPNISGGNPCLVGISGGGAGPGIGITFGVGYSDRGCERRNSAALLSNIGERDVAVELMCDDDGVRQAMARTGHPCAADRPAAVAAVDPAVVRRQQDAVVPQQIAAKPTRPDWCETASVQERRTHPACD